MCSFAASLRLHSATVVPDDHSLFEISCANFFSFFIERTSSSAMNAPSHASPQSPSSSIAELNAAAAETKSPRVSAFLPFSRRALSSSRESARYCGCRSSPKPLKRRSSASAISISYPPAGYFARFTPCPRKNEGRSAGVIFSNTAQHAELRRSSYTLSRKRDHSFLTHAVFTFSALVAIKIKNLQLYSAL